MQNLNLFSSDDNFIPADDYQAWNVNTNQMIAKNTTLRSVVDDWRIIQKSIPIDYGFIVIANYVINGCSLGVPRDIYQEEANEETVLKPSHQIPLHLVFNGTLEENHNVAAEIYAEQEFFRSAGYVEYDVFEMEMDRNEWVALQAEKEGITSEEFYMNLPTNREEEEKNLPSEPQDTDDLTDEDRRDKIVGVIVQRRGQPEFRQKLIAAYNGKCSVTGCDAVEALEAAHIFPYRGGHTNFVNNGLLLRADIHTLFDLGLIAVDTKDMTIKIAKELKSTTYAGYENEQLLLPSNEADWPQKTLLDEHRRNSKINI